ncbi:MAG: GspH/FimT family pseudopilin [Ahniella sp.]|nr:GspH/FimT family pseudopilin [Ahniella sp.]
MRIHTRQHGFTLIEVIAVLALIAIVVGSVAFSFNKSLGGAKIRSSVKDVVAALRYTRGQAIVKGEEKALEVDVEARTYQAPGKNPVTLPEGLDMKLLTAQSELTEDGKGRIRFYPDGSSTGGRVTILRDTKEWRVEVAWLTGEVRLEEDK